MLIVRLRHLKLRCGSDGKIGKHPSADVDLSQGPLVGQRQPSTAITIEYASADPVYQAKTTVSREPETEAQYADDRRPFLRNTRIIEPFAAMARADGEVRCFCIFDRLLRLTIHHSRCLWLLRSAHPSGRCQQARDGAGSHTLS